MKKRDEQTGATGLQAKEEMEAQVRRERAILGSILLAPALWPTLKSSVEPRHFRFAAHRRIFEAMLAASGDGSPPDLVLVANELGPRGDLKSVGGIAYLAQLAQYVPAGANFEAHLRQFLAAAETGSAIGDQGSVWDTGDNGNGRKVAAPFVLWNAQELLGVEFPAIRWVVPDILPEGLCLLAGSPKVGKSWFALGLCIATATGGAVLGQYRVEPGDALCLALEDNPRRLQSRMRKILGSGPADLSRLTCTTSCEDLSRGGLGRIEDWLRQHPGRRLVVVDTLAKIRPARTKTGDVYAEDYAALQGLKALSDAYRVALVIVHHTRKATAEDPLDSISGSHGLSGGVDSCLVLQRRRAKADAFLHVMGRDIERETELALRWDAMAGQWIVSGDAEEVRRSTGERAILSILSRAGKPMGPRDIWHELQAVEPDVTENAVQMRLRAMTAGGFLQYRDRGRYALTPPLSLTE